MGKRLYQIDATFRSALDRCAELAKPLISDDLLDVMFEDSSKLDTTLYSQVAVFAIEYALAEMWLGRGVVPYALLGHSVGEFAAAVIAGVLSLEDGVKLVAARGKLIQEKCDPEIGAMASIFASVSEVQAVISQLNFTGDSVAVVAAVNGPLQTVVSGHKAAVEQVCSKVKADNKKLSISHAMHSPLLAPILPEMLKAAKSCKLQKPSKFRLVSILKGKEVSDEVADPKYWVGHDEVKPMLFVDGMETLERLGCNTFIEVGPQPVLVKMGRRCVANSKNYEWRASMQPGRDESESLLLVSRVLGIAFHRPLELKPLSLPWGPPFLHPLLGQQRQEGEDAIFESNQLSRDGQVMELFRQHCVFGQVVLPGASHLAGCGCSASAYSRRCS
jgi:myxalamid-type polyketide synthase MxaB